MSSSDARGDFKSQVLQTTDIVELISRTVALKRAGKDFKGLCPFHQEKSPSFTVSPTKQFFYCYGCKASGNAIDFVIKRDRVEFIDALKFLADQAGLEMPRYGVSKEKASERQALLDAHSAACAFFERLLSDPAQGKAAREYLEKRGFDAESVKRFQLGLAPDSWDALLKGPVGRKFPPDVLLRGGLVKKREKGDGHYDTFRNRLMFPIKDGDGRVIAFGGRVMPGSQDPAKYLNSPETPLFSKGRSVFGLHLARQKIVESRTVVVVEGYTDVVMAHQFGVSNVVSVLGTAMTEQHVALLRRYLPEEGGRIVLLFDADAAGDLAVDRTVGLFLTQPVEIAIASMPEGTDPDEFILKQGPEAFDKLVANAQDALTYKWKRLSRSFSEGGDDLTGQQKAVEAYLQVLASARGSGPVDGLRWGAALARVSRLTGIPVDQLNRRFRNVPGAARAAAPATSAGTGASAENGGPAPLPGKRNLTAQDRAERWILGSLLLKPQLWDRLQVQVNVTDFADPVARRVAEMFWAYKRDEGEPVFNEFLGLLGEAARDGHPALQEYAVEAVDEVEALASTPGVDAREILAEMVGHLEQTRKLREQQKLFAELRRTETTAGGNDPDAPASDQQGDLRDRAEVREIEQLRRLQELARRPDLRRS